MHKRTSIQRNTLWSVSKQSLSVIRMIIAPRLAMKRPKHQGTCSLTSSMQQLLLAEDKGSILSLLLALA
eukprot:4811998-Amphidinium_carterae.1